MRLLACCPSQLAIAIAAASTPVPVPRSKVKLSVESAFIPEVDAWFPLTEGGLLVADADGGAGGLPGSPAPSFWMHLSQEYYLVAEKSPDILLNDFTVKCSDLGGFRERRRAASVPP